MDKTQKYILMCEKAEEIQQAWQPKTGDYIYRKYTVFGKELDKKIWDKDKREEVIILTLQSQSIGNFYATNEKGEERYFSTYEDMTKATSIFLPRQDQLQKIIAYKEFKPQDYIDELNMIAIFLKTNQFKFSSWEQAWIMYYMFIIYGKSWNDKQNEWERIK